MLRTLVSATAGIAAFFAVHAARAESPAATLPYAKFIVSADRLLPVLSYANQTDSDQGTKTTNSTTTAGLFAGNPFGNAMTFPRVSVDVLVIPHLTLGGSVWFYTELGGNQTTSNGGREAPVGEKPKTTIWGLAPRVGYIIPVTDILAIWPRGGLEYFSSATSTTPAGVGGNSSNQLAVDLEAILVITPWQHFGFTAGPTATLPVSGTATTGGQVQVSHDRSTLVIALSGGLLGYF